MGYFQQTFKLSHNALVEEALKFQISLLSRIEAGRIGKGNIYSPALKSDHAHLQLSFTLITQNKKNPTNTKHYRIRIH